MGVPLPPITIEKPQDRNPRRSNTQLRDRESIVFFADFVTGFHFFIPTFERISESPFDGFLESFFERLLERHFERIYERRFERIYERIYERRFGRTYERSSDRGFQLYVRGREGSFDRPFFTGSLFEERYFEERLRNGSFYNGIFVNHRLRFCSDYDQLATRDDIKHSNNDEVRCLSQSFEAVYFKKIEKWFVHHIKDRPTAMNELNNLVPFTS